MAFTIKLTLSDTTKAALKTSENVKEVTQAVVRYMDYFMGLTPRKAYVEHAKMRFAPQAFIEKNDLLKEAGVTEEVLVPLYEDLAANYSAMHSNCWLNDETHQFPESLIDALGGDRTVLKKIQDSVGNAYATGFDIGHLRKLLTAKESNFRFGGLRKLGFTKKEAEVLLDVAKEIYEYVEENFTVRPCPTEAVCEAELTEKDETPTAVEATYEESFDEAVKSINKDGFADNESLKDFEKFVAEAESLDEPSLSDKLKTAYLIGRTLLSQIEDIAKEVGIELS